MGPVIERPVRPVEEDALARGAWLVAAAVVIIIIVVVSLSLPLFVQGRASGVAALWHSGAGRMRRIEQVERAKDISIAKTRSSALIQ